MQDHSGNHDAARSASLDVFCTYAAARRNPALSIFIDGKVSGPFGSPIRVTPGTHELAVKGGGWRSPSVTVTLAEGEHKNADVRLSPQSLAGFSISLCLAVAFIVWQKWPAVATLPAAAVAFLVFVRYAPFPNLKMRVLADPGPLMRLIVHSNEPYLKAGMRIGVYVDGDCVGNVEQMALVPFKAQSVYVGSWTTRSNVLRVVPPPDGHAIKLCYGNTRVSWVLIILAVASFLTVGALAIADYAGSGGPLMMVFLAMVFGWIFLLWAIRPWVQTLYLNEEG